MQVGNAAAKEREIPSLVEFQCNNIINILFSLASVWKRVWLQKKQIMNNKIVK